MYLKFKKYQYQTDATQSVVDIFSGQSAGERRESLSRQYKADGRLIESVSETFFANKNIELTESDILHNVQEVQKENGLPVANTLNGGYNFTVEMETGTGKTYVYTKTMFELNKHYGWSKFIIMVPSVAIREGVHKSLEITADHFQAEYGKKIRFFIYDTKNKSNLVNIKNFANTGNIEVVVMNYQAFATRSKNSRKIYQKLDQTNSRKPIDIIKSTRPILIIDEPQRFGKTAESLLKEFDPLFITRYSATHKKDYNKVYRLDAIDAYNKKLVKKISVKGIEVVGNSGTSGYIFFDRISITHNTPPKAYLEFEVRQKNGIQRKIKKVKEGDKLYELSGELAEYKGLVVKSIDGRTNTISFTSGLELCVGQTVGDISEAHLRRIQIRETIRSHIEKERMMYRQGIKVLTLFFIDEVAKYRVYDDSGQWKKGAAEYERIFEEEYNNAIADRDSFDPEYQQYLEKYAPDQIHKGYFSVDKKSGNYVDSKGKGKENISDDISAYDLIMKSKERLLSFAEPTRFIFSHSTLREGWDNPNVFQICTLKHSQSTISKRQEIGRGLRICVNNEGSRMDSHVLENKFFDYNTLTVVASESYETFAEQLQEEIVSSLSDRPTKLTTDILRGRVFKTGKGDLLELGDMETAKLLVYLETQGYINESQEISQSCVDAIETNTFTLPSPFSGFEEEISAFILSIHTAKHFSPTTNAKAENIDLENVVPNDNFYKQEFQHLRSKIKTKTVYEVDFNTDELIEKSINTINNSLEVRKVTISITSGSMRDTLDDVSLKAGESMDVQTRGRETSHSLLGGTTYDLVGEITKQAIVTRKTVVRILAGIQQEKFHQYQMNPEDFIRQVSRLINEQKATTLINAITYSKTSQSYTEDVFTINQLKGSLQENILEVQKHIYDYVKTDSHTERIFAQNLESDEVMVYAKLPNDFKIPTPVGNYNPDWAIVFDDTKNSVKYVYFVAETKGSMSDLQLKKAEELKIAYAKKHFEALDHPDVQYDMVQSYQDLLDKVL